MEPKGPVNPMDIYDVNFVHQMHSSLQSSPFHLKAPSNSTSSSSTLSSSSMEPPSLDRYSDKYVRAADGKSASNLGNGRINGIITDLSFFPSELHSVYNAELAARIQARVSTKSTSSSFQDTLAKLKLMEQGDRNADEQEVAEEEELEDEAVYEEEELEDENDYGMSYFDNGEDYGDYDDGDEGPVYWIVKKTTKFCLCL